MAKHDLIEEREKLLTILESWFELPRVFLALLWLGLLASGLSNGFGPLHLALGAAIWAFFALNFALELLIAPRRGAFLRTNPLIPLSAILPGLGVFRLLPFVKPAAPAAPPSEPRLLRTLLTLNRVLGAFARHMRRRGLGYVLALTFVVVPVCAAGIFLLERDPTGAHGFASYGAALSWMSMPVTLRGTSEVPHTAGGRILGLFAALYGFALLAYFTAALASFFVGRDADEGQEVAGARALREVQAEVTALRSELQSLVPLFTPEDESEQ